MKIEFVDLAGRKQSLEPKKVLVSKLRALGDTVLITATLGELKRLLPGVEIHVLVPKQWQEIFVGHTWIQKVWTLDTKTSFARRIFDDLKLLTELRREGFDLSFALQSSPRTQFLNQFCGAKFRVAHSHNFSEPNRASDVAIPGRETLKHLIARDLLVLRAIGLDINPNAPTYLARDDIQAARLKKLCNPKMNLGLALGASRSPKRWLTSQFAKVAEYWIKLYGEKSVHVFVSPNEIELVQSFLDELLKLGVSSEQVNVFTQLSLTELKAGLSLMNLLVANDSGPRHVAVAVGTKTITIFGPQEPFESHPYDPKRHPYLFKAGLDCRTNTDPSGVYKWCGIETCIEKAHKCMTDIPAEAVIAEIEKLFPKVDPQKA